MKIPLGVCPSTNRIAPAGNTLFWLTADNDARAVSENWQKWLLRDSGHWQHTPRNFVIEAV